MKSSCQNIDLTKVWQKQSWKSHRVGMYTWAGRNHLKTWIGPI